MRSSVVIGGILLIAIGFFLVSYSGLSHAWASFSDGDPGSAGFFSPQIMGLGLMGLGFLTFIAGLVASPAEKVRHTAIGETPQVREKQSVASASTASPTLFPTLLAICPQCKARISPEVKFCPECGADLRPKTKQKT